MRFSVYFSPGSGSLGEFIIVSPSGRNLALPIVERITLYQAEKVLHDKMRNNTQLFCLSKSYFIYNNYKKTYLCLILLYDSTFVLSSKPISLNSNHHII